MRGPACSEVAGLSAQLDLPAELASLVVVTAYHSFLWWQEERFRLHREDSLHADLILLYSAFGFNSGSIL